MVVSWETGPGSEVEEDSMGDRAWPILAGKEGSGRREIRKNFRLWLAWIEGRVGRRHRRARGESMD